MRALTFKSGEGTQGRAGMGRARREALARMCREATAWMWGVASMCWVRPAEGQLHIMIQWVVKSEQAVGTAMGALQDTTQLQTALRRAISDVYAGAGLGNQTNRTVSVSNVTAQVRDLSAPPAPPTVQTPLVLDTPAGASESSTVLVAAAGGMVLVAVAWIMTRRPRDGATGKMGHPMIRIRMTRL